MRALLLILFALLSFPAFSSSYIKVANNGTDLPDSALLGTGPTDWACTRDSRSGLLWEVKTTDGGLRDKDKSYTNYDDLTMPQQRGARFPTQAEIDAATNSIGFAKAVNASSLCGQSDWRMPSKDELANLLETSYTPMIDPTFFPNTPTSYYWSNSHFKNPYGYEDMGRNVGFYDGYFNYNYRDAYYNVRLVRGGPSFTSFALSLSATGSGYGSVAGSTGAINCSSEHGTTWGTCSANLASGTTLTLTATAGSGNRFTGWSGACSGTSASCTLTLDAAKSVSAAFVFVAPSSRYSKIANNGTVLSDSAVFGMFTGPTAWACTRDNTTGLLWEVKTQDGGLRDWSKFYTNYDDPTQPQKLLGGNAYVNPTQADIDAASNSIGFTKAVNAAGLCGQSDWRMPSKDELSGLIDKGYLPKINPTFFPDIYYGYFWSGSPSTSNTYFARLAGLYTGFIYNGWRDSYYSVRLVRTGQAVASFALSLTATGSGSGTLASTTGGLNCTSTAGTTSGTCSANLASGTPVTLTATPSAGSTFTGWSGACSSGTTPSICTVTMDAAKSVSAAFTLLSYSKIANNGSVLADSAVLGSSPADWACTRDNVSGLLWEVKTTDATGSGLRDMSKGYTNYDDPTQPQKGGWNGNTYVASNPTQAEIDAASNSIGFAKAVNASNLCGQRDWRMPSKDELFGLVALGSSPTISPSFFPNTPSSIFWSGSPSVGHAASAWIVDFDVGLELPNFARDYNPRVRLVRGGQPLGTFTLSFSASGIGSGTLTGSPGSLNCTSSAGTTSGICSASLVSGTAVTLAATPSSGSSFSGWSGACSGSSPTCTLTMDAAKSVSANFNRTLTPAKLGLLKTVVNTGGGSATAAQFTLTASGPTVISGPAPVAAANAPVGVYTLTESSLANYTAGLFSCSGGGTLAGNQLTIAAADAGKTITCTITNTFTPSLLSQTITFGPAPSVTVGGTGTVSASASSGLPVTMTSSTLGICTLSGNTVRGVAAGLCTLAAHQAGNSSFSPAAQALSSFSIAAAALPPGPPTNISIAAGRGSATLMFSAPSGSAIARYTASCAASGQTTRAATGSASPLTVRNLSGGVQYQCTLTATDSSGSTSVASAAQPVTPAVGKNSLTPILMLLLD